jgi:hypothetical protein
LRKCEKKGKGTTIVIGVEKYNSVKLLRCGDLRMRIFSLAARPLYGSAVEVRRGRQTFELPIIKNKGVPFIFDCSKFGQLKEKLGNTSPPILYAENFKEGDQIKITFPSAMDGDLILKALLWPRP